MRGNINHFNHRCYKTKDDKRHNTSFFNFSNISKEHWESIFGTEEERLKKLNDWKINKLCNELAENSVDTPDAPNISTWDNEWTYLATGKRMSKKELKRYCKEHGKIWENE
jgi:hypothetical protein